MNTNTGGPAFPVEVDVAQPEGRQTGNTVWQAYGMTLRDYFAAKAMQALLGYEESTLQNDAKVAYQMADAMLKARKS